MNIPTFLRPRKTMLFIAILCSIASTVSRAGANPSLFTLSSAQLHGCAGTSRVLSFSLTNVATAAAGAQAKLLVVHGMSLSGSVAYPLVGVSSTVNVSVNLDEDPTFPGSSLTITGFTANNASLQSSTIVPTVIGCQASTFSQSGTNAANSLNTSDLSTTASRFKANAPNNVSFPHSSTCSTADQKMTCINSGFGLIVAFTYDSSGMPPIDGFRVYRVDNGAHTYIASVKSSYAVVVPAPSSGDFTGQCFAVVAVSRSFESNASTPKCATASDSLHDAVLKADTTRSYAYYAIAGGGLIGDNGLVTRVASVAIPMIGLDPLGSQQNFGDKYGTSPSLPSVGFAYDTHKMLTGDASSTLYVRFGAHFNLAPYAGHSIQKATLTLVAKKTMVNYSSSTGNCAKQVGVSTADWVSNQNKPLDSVDPTQWIPLKNSGTNDTVDVIGAVDSWLANPGKNDGFIFRNPDENLTAFTESSCLTVFDSSTLDIQYF